MRKIFPLVLLLSLSMAGCATQVPASSAYNSANDARIRVYFGTTTNFYFNTRCEPKKGLPGFGDNGVAVAKPRLLNLSNTTIGMPIPSDAYKYYDEYVVKANQPLLITLDTGGSSQTGAVIFSTPRQHVAGVFVPQPGRDYEAFAAAETTRLRLTVRELHVKDGQVSSELIPFEKPPQC